MNFRRLIYSPSDRYSLTVTPGHRQSIADGGQIIAQTVGKALETFDSTGGGIL